MPTLYDNFSQVKQYIDQEIPDLTSYVTKTELAACSYVTSADLPVINESIIPKETNTYTLGDESHLYSATYSSRLKVGNNSQIYNDGGGISFSINSNNGIRIGSSAIYPKTSGAFNNGSSSNKWNATYTTNLYNNTAYLQDTSYSSSIVPKETATYTLGDSSYLYAATYTNRVNFGSNKVYIYNNGDTQMKFCVNGSDRFRIDYNKFMPAISNVETQLGTSNNPFTTTYTTNLYNNTAYLQDTSYSSSIVPKETNAYTLGDADHIYSASYTKSTYFTNNTKIVGSDSDIIFYTGGLSRIKINNNILRPDRSGVNLGTSSNKWAAIYTSNLYADTIHNFIWTGTSAEYAALSDYTTYQIYMIKEA